MANDLSIFWLPRPIWRQWRWESSRPLIWTAHLLKQLTKTKKEVIIDWSSNRYTKPLCCRNVVFCEGRSFWFTHVEAADGLLRNRLFAFSTTFVPTTNLGRDQGSRRTQLYSCRFHIYRNAIFAFLLICKTPRVLYSTRMLFCGLFESITLILSNQTMTLHFRVRRPYKRCNY